MANFAFKKATRTAKKIRVAVDGPSGSGKTYSLLRLAFALKAGGLCTKVAVIDSENGGSESYAGESPDGTPWEFDVLNLTTYSPTTYVQAMNAAVEAGYDCVIIDSLSHAWMGKDGALDLVDRKGGRFDAWKDVTPLQRQMIDAIIHCKAHVLASMRTKSEYVVEENEKGKKVPRKIGMAPVQRDGVEFEFDVYGTIDQEHTIRITKSRCSALQDGYTTKPDARFWSPLVKWLATAEPVQEQSPDKPRQAPQNSLPTTGSELHGRIQEYDAKLAAQKLCVRGALLAHVVAAGVKAGYSANVTEWSGPAIPYAVEVVKEFEASVRTPATDPNDPVHNLDALHKLLTSKGKDWTQAITWLGSQTKRGYDPVRTAWLKDVSIEDRQLLVKTLTTSPATQKA